MLRVCGGSVEKPLYALEATDRGVVIQEDSETGFFAVVKRLFLQLTGKRVYNFQHVAAHIAEPMDTPFRGHCLGKVSQGFRVQLSDRDIKIMGQFASIDQE